MTNDESSIVYDEAGNRFSYSSDQGTGVLKFRRDYTRIYFLHTEVSEGLRGQGVGAKLAKAGLEFARANKLRVIAQCPFVRKYIMEHAQYQDLVEV
ncbi:MAG: N-acetyltransferase [Oscillochloris sp.]|nr:N-acetyltransferase [Oscillochloris sp.]